MLPPKKQQENTLVTAIRIALVLSHPLFRQALQCLLNSQPDFHLVGVTGLAAEALRVVEENAADIVIFESGGTGIDGAKQLCQARPETKSVFISVTEDESTLFDCMESGASGFLSRGAAADELSDAIRLVARGGTYLTEPALSRFVEGWKVRRNGTVAEGPGLTNRENEVLKLLAEGNSVRNCAELLGVSAKTVEAHKFNLMRKLGIHNKVQLVRYAYQKRIVQLAAFAS